MVEALAQDLLVAAHKQTARLPQAAVGLQQRAKLLLDTLAQIKNNRHRQQAPTSAFWIKPADVAPLQLAGVTWQQLAAPDKKVSARHNARSEAQSPGLCPHACAACQLSPLQSLCALPCQLC